MNRKATILVAPLAIATLASCGVTDDPSEAGQSSRTVATRTAEVDSTSMPPWPAPIDDVLGRVQAAGLDLGPMGTAEHYHPRLEVVIDGAAVKVPANIGVDPTTGAMSALHTHEDDGTIHIEADREGATFTLGQLFVEWGVKLSPTQIGGVKAEPGEKVSVTSSGQPVVGDPRDLEFAPDQTIVLRVP